MEPGTTRFITSRTFSPTKPVRAMRVQRMALSLAISGTVIRGEAMAMNSTSVAAARGCSRSRKMAICTWAKHRKVTGRRGSLWRMESM